MNILKITVAPMRYCTLIPVLLLTTKIAVAQCDYEMLPGDTIIATVPQSTYAYPYDHVNGSYLEGQVGNGVQSDVFEPGYNGTWGPFGNPVGYGTDAIMNAIAASITVGSGTNAAPAFKGIRNNHYVTGWPRFAMYAATNLTRGTRLTIPAQTVSGTTYHTWSWVKLYGPGAAEYCARNNSLTLNRTVTIGIGGPPNIVSFPMILTNRLYRKTNTTITVTPTRLEFGMVTSAAMASINLTTRFQSTADIRYDLTYSYIADSGPQHDLTANGQQLPVTYSNLVTDAQGNNDHVVTFGLRSTAQGSVNGRLLVTAQIR